MTFSLYVGPETRVRSGSWHVRNLWKGGLRVPRNQVLRWLRSYDVAVQMRYLWVKRTKPADESANLLKDGSTSLFAKAGDGMAFETQYTCTFLRQYQ